MSDPQVLPEGEFEIREVPQDVFRGFYASLGGIAIYLLLMWLAAIVALVQALAAGESPSGEAIGGSAGIGAVLVIVIISALRTKGRSWTIRLTEQNIAARRETGEVSLNWAALTAARQRAGMLVLSAGRMSIVLPLYRMSPVQVSSIRSRLAAHGINEKTQKQGARKFKLRILLWALLVLVFVALYNVVNPP